MADPKYANLPGIDREQPDVFETNDLPEDDQAQLQPDELNSETVEKIPVDASDAYNKFKGKGISGGSTDFSDRISQGRRIGYDITRTEYEIVGEGSGVGETPQQKFQRLQHEIRILAEEVNQVKENMKTESENEALSPVNLAKHVEYLQHQLTDLHLDKVIGTPGAVNLADPQGALQKRLLTELDSFKEVKKGKAASGQQQVAAGDGDHVTYQLYYRPEQAKFSNNARVADLEQRLERMEALLGQNTDKMSALASDTNSKSLLSSVAMLNAKTKLLDASQVDQVEGRLAALNQKLIGVLEKKDVVEQADKANKVSELYELVKKWDSLTDTLPHIVDRFVALKKLHEQALQFSQTLTHLDTAQQEIKGHLTSHTDMLKTVDGSLGENMTSIKANFSSLDTRVKGLKK